MLFAMCLHDIFTYAPPIVCLMQLCSSILLGGGGGGLTLAFLAVCKFEMEGRTDRLAIYLRNDLFRLDKSLGILAAIVCIAVGDTQGTDALAFYIRPK